MLCALTALLPAPGAAAAPTPESSKRATALADARTQVAAAEEHLASVIELERVARERLTTLTDRDASLVRQIADARSDARAWMVDAFVTDRDAFAYLLAGSGSDVERSARVAFAASAAEQKNDAAARYEALRSQVAPELHDLAVGIAEVETARVNANNAVFAARAQEAEAERQYMLHVRREEELAAAALAKTAKTVASTASAPGATAQVTAAAPGDLGLEGPPAPEGGPTEAQWAKLRHCEATGNYQAVSKSGKYRGAYQFDRATWATLGPPGDPAAASPAEQDRRARLLYASRGSRPWPECGRHLR